MTDWKKEREVYIEKFTNEYKVNGIRGINKKNIYKCPICGANHLIDKYNWVQSCKGYMHLSEFYAKFLEGEKNGEEKI